MNINMAFGKSIPPRILISITEQVRTALDNQKYAIGVFVDFQKAFDTVDHNILLGKLDQYGITGNTNKWFRSYLKDRKQIASIPGFESNQRTLSHGVPSVLGPSSSSYLLMTSIELSNHPQFFILMMIQTYYLLTIAHNKFKNK